jgi:hypothetical protein
LAVIDGNPGLAGAAGAMAQVAIQRSLVTGLETARQRPPPIFARNSQRIISRNQRSGFYKTSNGLERKTALCNGVALVVYSLFMIG